MSISQHTEYNPQTFAKRSMAEKLIENTTILENYVQYAEEALSNDLFRKLYFELIPLVRFIREEILKSNCLNTISERTREEIFIESANSLEAAISCLLELMMYLHRAIRHRSPLFDQRIKFYETHYAFQPMYKSL